MTSRRQAVGKEQGSVAGDGVVQMADRIVRQFAQPAGRASLPGSDLLNDGEPAKAFPEAGLCGQP